MRQVDDSTCAILPLYQNEFALVAPMRPPRLGVHIETLPEAKWEFQRTSKMRIASLAKGARPGARDVRAWRDYVLVLFDGTTTHRLRLIDVYDRQTLRYRGSTRLPFEATRFAVRGDTMVVVGEVDDEPMLAAFMLRMPRAATTPSDKGMRPVVRGRLRHALSR